MTEQSQARIAATLAQHLGMAAGSVGNRVIESAIRRRMVATGIDRADAYADRVATDRRELDELIEAVVVPETWFFRYPESFRHLTRWALDRRAAAPSRTLRILSAPCATGEEPYSIAAALLDAGLPPGSFKIEALDVCRRAVRIAQAARYGEVAFREQNGQPKGRYFQTEGREVAVHPDARAAVNFRVGNLIDPGVLAGEAPFDAIFCRNLFIYLTDEARRKVIETLERVLAPDGLVYMGHAEPLGLMDARFRTVSPPAAFAFTRADPPPRLDRATPAAELPLFRAPKFPAFKKPKTEHSIQLPPAGAAASILDQARAAADRGDLDAAVTLCEQHQKRNGPDPDALTLMGVIRAGAGDPGSAERDFTQALFLDPGHYDALLQMYALAERRGDATAAANYRRRIDQAARREGRP